MPCFSKIFLFYKTNVTATYHGASVYSSQHIDILLSKCGYTMPK